MNDDDAVRRNAILRQLPEREYRRLRAKMAFIEAEIRQEVYQPDQPITDVYFPLSSVYSLVGWVNEHQPVEVATIGHEGMVGLPLFLGANTSPHAAFCQIPGDSLRLGAEDLRSALRLDGVLHRTLNRFTQATMVQVAQNVVCNGAHATQQRAARWLLTTHDRVRRDQFLLTQNFLAQMLGVRRPTVSEVAQGLQDQGLIRYSRGLVTIVDRARLEQVACPCYAIVRAEFDAITHGE
jgi:CRP-like cAMP-binding protein